MASNTFIVSFLHNGKFYGWTWNEVVNEWFANLPPNPSLELLNKLEQTRPRSSPPVARPPTAGCMTTQERLVEAALAQRPEHSDAVFQNPYRFADCE